MTHESPSTAAPQPDDLSSSSSTQEMVKRVITVAELLAKSANASSAQPDENRPPKTQK